MSSGYTLCTYTGQPLQILGRFTHNGYEKVLPLYVVKGNEPTLLGRNWLLELKLDWKQIMHVNRLSTSETCASVMSHKHVRVLSSH